MKSITYTGSLGPEKVAFGEAGIFIKGQPREVDDSLVDKLMKKGCFTLTKEKQKEKVNTDD